VYKQGNLELFLPRLALQPEHRLKSSSRKSWYLLSFKCFNLYTPSKDEGKDVPLHTTVPYGGGRGIAPLILNLSARRAIGQPGRCTAGKTEPDTHCTRSPFVDCVWNVMAHAQKPDFIFRRNGRVHLNRRGRQFCWLAAEVCASAVVMLDTTCSQVVWRVVATHSIRQFPLHFPSCASPCAITFQLDSTSYALTCSVQKVKLLTEYGWGSSNRL
jgi:hypothetical protein